MNTGLSAAEARGRRRLEDPFDLDECLARGIMDMTRRFVQIKNRSDTGVCAFQ